MHKVVIKKKKKKGGEKLVKLPKCLFIVHYKYDFIRMEAFPKSAGLGKFWALQFKNVILKKK